MKIVARGAEAVLRKDGNRLIKERVREGYRITELDSRIRGQRTRTEERLLSRARRSGVSAPIVWDSRDYEIVMEWINGSTVKDSLNGLSQKDRLKVYEQIGKAAAGLHAAGIMHGDLTTSNMILREGNPKNLYIVDFGLAKTSRRIEDHAVDLYLLYGALKAAHFRFLDESWKNIIKAYKYNYTIADKVLERLGKIERRRRYRGE